MRLRLIGTIVGLACPLAGGFGATAAAQASGMVELGLFGRYTHFDETLGFGNRQGGGARVGLFLSRAFSLEVDGSYTDVAGPGGAAASFIPLHARVLVHVPIGELSALSFGPAYVRHEYRDAIHASENGAGGLVGLRLALTPWLALRTDFTADYIPSPVNAARDNWNVGGQAGLSLMLGAVSRDADADGVPNRVDRCPATPAAQRVDAAGCPRDSDGDGVADGIDRCADTAQGLRVDAGGCPIDSDGDGVMEEADRCPGTPSGQAVDGRGCPPPPDADGDGVPDDADHCAGSRAGEAVDASGCARDADGDGVRDADDRCPATPAGTQVDAVGCRILFALERTTLVLEGVTFATGRAELTEAARAILLTVAQSLAANDSIRVEVGGHTDNTGSRATNLALSQARAEAVRQYLARHGVAPDRLVARGYGPDSPVAGNGTREGRAQNRRVELRRID